MLDFDIKHYIQADSGFRFSIYSCVEFVVCRWLVQTEHTDLSVR